MKKSNKNNTEGKHNHFCYPQSMIIFVVSFCVVSLVRSVRCAPHTLSASVVNSIRTEDIFAPEELSFKATRREKITSSLDACHLHVPLSVVLRG